MIEVFSDIRLRDKTFYGIGGVADEFIVIDDPQDLSEIWAETIAKQIPKIVLGKGSNMVFSDKGFRGRVFYPGFEGMEQISSKVSPSKSPPNANAPRGDLKNPLPLSPIDTQNLDQRGDLPHRELIISVEVGKNFQDFIAETNRLGFEDLCPLSGIPGNVGGFIRGNAGAMGVETADFVVGVEYLDEDGNLQKISGQSCDFSYRESLFKENPDLFVVRGIFRFTKACDPKLAKQKTDEMLAHRWKKYPPGRSGGCVFKNPEGDFAGKILEELGAKGDRIGEIEIAEAHANFFVNKGNGSQKDILELVKKWQEIAEKKLGTRLEPEIYLVDEFGGRVL